MGPGMMGGYGSGMSPSMTGGYGSGYGGWLFLKGLFDELRSGRPGMMTLFAVAITTAQPSKLREEESR